MQLDSIFTHMLESHREMFAVEIKYGAITTTGWYDQEIQTQLGGYDAVVYENSKSISLLLNTYAAPAIGDTVQIAGVDHVVMSVEQADALITKLRVGLK